MAVRSGREAYVLYSEAELPMQRWTINDKSPRIDISNFTSPGARRQFLGGFKEGNFTTEGPYDPALPTPRVGDTVAMEFGVGTGVYVVCDAYVEEVVYSQDIEASSRMTITGVLTGDPTFSGLA